MINCTNHALTRWAQRIVDENLSYEEAKEYGTRNRDILIRNINTTFEYASFIYKGQIGDNVTRNYYIKDDIIFVTNTQNDALVTVYKVDLGFPKDLNSTIRKGLLKEIQRLSEEQEQLEKEIDEEIRSKEIEIENMQEEEKILKEKLDNLQSSIAFKEKEIKHIKTKSIDIGLEIRKYTLNLVNSKEYKEDLQKIK